MKTIAFHSMRGGVGKTVISVNVALQLALTGKKICLVDFDLRAPSLKSYFSNGELSVDGDEYITDFLLGKKQPSDVILTTKIDNFFIGFSDIEILQKQNKDRQRLTQHGEGRILAKLFELIRYCSKEGFDYLILDCMPGITYRSLDALVVSDNIFVVTRSVNSELIGLNLLINECYAKLDDTNVLAIINQVENIDDLKNKPSDRDIELGEENKARIINLLSENKIPVLYEFPRIPFVTERTYILVDENHPFTINIKEFVQKLLTKI